MKKVQRKRPTRFGNLIYAVLIGLGTLILLFSLLLAGIAPDQYDIHVGQPASKTVYATKDVEDTVTTEAQREAAAKSVEPIYKSVDSTVNVVVNESMQAMFSDLWQTREEYLTRTEPISELLEEINASAPFGLTSDMLVALLQTDETQYNAVVASATAEMRDALNASLPEGQENAAVTRIARELLRDGYPQPLTALCENVLRACVQPNMLIDHETTEANRQKARESVEPEILVKREVIVREGEIVTEAEYQMIASLGLLADDTLDLPLFGGLALLLIVLFGIIVLFFWQYDPEILRDWRVLLLLGITIILQVSVCLLVRTLNSYLMPVAMSAILIYILIGPKTALFINSVLAFIVSMLVSSDGLFSMSMFSVMMMAFTAGPIAAAVISKRPLRSGTLLAGFVIGAVNFLVTFSIGLISSANLHTTLLSSLWALGSGVFSAVLALGLQALLEWVFNLATNAKLIELSNPNQPLLRRLLLEAPGTYHHSIIVANLAEAGAAAIGANGLLARVGAYYHDVGKLKRPMYFKENQLGDNPHDRTDPRVSAAILTAHPRDGAQMAQKARIPAKIIEIIRQHHGDSPVMFFYDKAVKLYGDDVDVSAFRYEGPRPTSREAAVVMLADTIEAATRTLTNPTPEKVEELIRKLVRGKLDDGQLNDSALTFNDIDKICSTFCTVLTGVFHERIEYPDIPVPPRPHTAETAEPAPEEAQTNPPEGAQTIPSEAEATRGD